MSKYYDGFGREVTLEISQKDREHVIVVGERNILKIRVLEIEKRVEKQSKTIQSLRLENKKLRKEIKNKEDEICQVKHKKNVIDLTGEETPSEPKELENSQNKAKTVN